jgi:hypothetical protein
MSINGYSFLPFCRYLRLLFYVCVYRNKQYLSSLDVEGPYTTGAEPRNDPSLSYPENGAKFHL